MSIFYLPCHQKKGKERVLGTDPAKQTKQNPLQKLKSKFAVKTGAWEVLRAQEVLKK
jgi:hypothetical protein